MRSVRVCLLLLAALSLLYPATGWITPVTAAEKEEKAISTTTTTAEGKTPGREEAKDEAKENECPATFGPIITDTAIPMDKGRFALQPTWGLSFVTNTFSPSWRRIPAGGDFKSFGMSVKLTYGLLNNLEVYTVIPYIHNWADRVEARGPNGERSADFGGIGDVNLTFKYRLVPEGPVAPTTSAIFAVGFPSGHSRHLNPVRLGTDVIGGGAYVFTTGLNLSKYLRPFIFYGNFYYSFQTDCTTDEVDENGNPFQRVNHPRDFVTVNLAAEYPITKKWVALVELTSTWDGGRLFGAKCDLRPGALLSLLPGIEYMATEKFSLALGVNIDLYGKNHDANITPILSMVYAF
ncbi:MAG: transporter [Pseudomonadota bacterium]